MQQRQEATSTPYSGAGGCLRHVVLPLLRPSRAPRAASAHDAESHAVLHRPSPSRTYSGGCFAGAEGDGCALSEHEQRIAAWVGDGPMSWEV